MSFVISRMPLFFCSGSELVHFDRLDRANVSETTAEEIPHHTQGSKANKHGRCIVHAHTGDWDI